MVKHMKSIKHTFLAVAFALAALAPAYAGDDKDAQREALEQRMQEAQLQLEEASQKIAELSRELSKGEVMTYFQGIGKHHQRAMLGVTVGKVEKEAGGVAITGVSPGGPASAAGLQAGDIVTSINGLDLESTNGGNAVKALLDGLARLAPGDVAKLQVRRDSERLSVDVVTENLSRAMPMINMRVSKNGHMPDQNIMEMLEDLDDEHFGFDDGTEIVINLDGMEALKDLPGRLEDSLSKLENFPGIAMFGGPLGLGPQLSLVPVDGDLGTYFGVDHGLLLTEAPTSDLGLKAGDVILSIDGDPVTKKSEVRQKFVQSRAGDVMAFAIVRQGSALTIDVTLPDTAVMGDWTCTAAEGGNMRKCVRKNGKAFQFQFSDD